MSSEPPWSRGPNIVGNVLGVLTGVIMIVGAGYLTLEGGPPELILPLGGFGVLIAVVGAYSAVGTVRELGRAGVTDPVVILKKDVRPPDEIVGRLVRLALLWVGLLVFYAVVVSTPSAAPAELLALARANPLLSAGVVLLNLLLVVATVFVRPGKLSAGPCPSGTVASTATVVRVVTLMGIVYKDGSGGVAREMFTVGLPRSPRPNRFAL